jgi:hypothetical protein
MHAEHPLDDTHGASRFVRMALAFGLCLLATRAHAAPCASDADCPVSFTCETIGQTACAAARACKPGAVCSTVAPCQAANIKVCRSAECRSDSDCPDDMICYWARPRPSCLPRYLLPCAHASDCGDGFDCNTEQQDDPHCVLQNTSCGSAQDCPAHFSCDVNTAVTACDAADAGADEDASTNSCDGAGNVCIPPYANVDFVAPRSSRHGGYVGPIVERWGSPGDHSGWSCSVRTAGARRTASALFAALLAAGVIIVGTIRARRRHKL